MKKERYVLIHIQEKNYSPFPEGGPKFEDVQIFDARHTVLEALLSCYFKLYERHFCQVL